MGKDRITFKLNEARAKGEDKSGKPKKVLKRNDHKVQSSNTIAYVQVLGTGMDTHDTLPSVLLFFDKQRFIFNAGEGLQRFCAEHKIKLSKIDHICLSRISSETTGGLPGLLLTLAGMGEGMSVNLWGPPNFDLLVNAMKSFIPHAAMVHAESISRAARVRMKGFGIVPCIDSKTLSETTEFTGPFSFFSNDIVEISAVFLQPSNTEGSDVKLSDISTLYICELSETMGKFNKEKAVELGVTVKEKYGELKSRKSVKSDLLDIMVHPSDVMGSPVPGPIVFIVDCPTDSHARELLSIKSLNSYYSDFQGTPSVSPKTVSCVIHLTPASVVNSPSYEKWVLKFGSTQHIMAGHAMKRAEIPILKSSARIAARLNYLCPHFFPAPIFWSPQLHNYKASGSIASYECPASKLSQSISAENLLKFTLRPHSHLGLDKSIVPNRMAPADVIDELLSDIPEIVDAAQCVSQFWHKPTIQDSEVTIKEPFLDGKTLPSCLENIRRDDLEIVFLGTGSSQPSKYRNVSCIYINLFSRGSLLLDCGEGTLAQLRRRYGLEGADDAVRNLRCIWISHIHADHQAGLARILVLRRNLLKGMTHEPLLVIGPKQLEEFLDEYKRLEDLDMQFLDCRNTMTVSWDAFEGGVELIKHEDMNNNSTNRNESTSLGRESCLQRFLKRQKLSIPADNSTAFPLLKSLKKVLSEAGLERLTSFPVVHCPEAFGVVLRAEERINRLGKVIPGWKVVYSGDTRPCPEVIEASEGATILIHEATFEDCMVGEAIARNHSTTKEAIDVGRSASAYRLILTHFSQRYPKIPTFDEMSMQETCIAFDLMSVNVADLPVLPNVLPYLKLLFKNEMIDDIDAVS